MKLGIGAVFKNETHIMIEWIEHYLEHGVDHIYLINDHSTDNIEIIRNMYANNTNITFYDSDVDSGPYQRQIDIYNKYLIDVMKQYDWFGIFDLDEFLYSPDHFNFKDVLISVPSDINQIFINWVSFASNGHETQPYSVVEGFTKRVRKIVSHKNLFRPSKLLKLDIHTHSVIGISKNFSHEEFPDNPPFLLNHYVIQSKSFFRSVKSTRGDVNKIVATGFRDMNYFNSYDLNEVEDYALFNQNKSIIERSKDKIKNFHDNYLSFF